MSVDDEEGWNPYGNCPVQVYGPADENYSFYFRARGEYWSLTVGVPDDDGYVSDDKAVWEAQGKWGGMFEAGWMDEKTTLKLVAESLRRYRAGEPSWEAPDHLYYDNESS